MMVTLLDYLQFREEFSNAVMEILQYETFHDILSIPGVYPRIALEYMDRITDEMKREYTLTVYQEIEQHQKLFTRQMKDALHSEDSSCG